MARTASIRSSSSSCSLGSVAALGLLALALASSPGLARACTGGDPDVAGETTFDPRVIGDDAPARLFYDPYAEGYGGLCDGECAKRELLADWMPYLAGVEAGDWSKVLFEADRDAIDKLIFFLQGKQPVPAGWERSSLVKLTGEGREKVIRALFLVGFARRVEPFAVARDGDDGAARKPKTGDPAALQRAGEKAFAAAKDPFLRQRYAFLLLRLRFHRQDWPGAMSFFEANAAALEAPSTSLRWRARYYLAGAHWRSKRYAEANLELARVATAAPGLAGSAVRDFHPLEESDWQATLALAKTPREKAWLWALVGVTQDGTAAMAEIGKLDPSSRWLALLAVREVNRLEYRKGDLAALERTCAELAGKKGVDRPWLLEAVAAHAAALRGELASTRRRLQRVEALAPAANARLKTQEQATLALALARTWKPGSAKVGDELAQKIPPSGTGQVQTAWYAVRTILSKTCEAAGMREDAELFVPTAGPSKEAWSEPGFIEALVKRVSTPKTPFERFMVEGSGYTPALLQAELARLHLVRGEFPAASRLLASLGDQPSLGTDPFVMHVVDCHDCDHKDNEISAWTLRSYAERLAALQEQAKGTGPAAAKAAYELGSGLYNLTWHGNARMVLASSHQALTDTTMAEGWFKRAYELAEDRELKARAATMAAKCELARDESATVSKTWYPALRTLEDTAYEKDVLKECGWYREWKAPSPKKTGK
jgi:hypothetical protein